MFKKTYTNTVKNLFRSPMLWISFLLVTITVIMWSRLGFRIGDGAVDYIGDRNVYLMLIPNALCVWVMGFAMPLFAVITTMIIIGDDYKNDFYEIERSSGISTVKYFMGRMLAIISVDFIVLILSSYVAVYSYSFTREFSDITAIECFFDAIPRVSRTVLVCELPIILFYIGLTCMITTMFKNGIYGAIAGSVYTLTMFARYSNVALRSESTLFSRYFTTLKISAYRYMTYFDTVQGEDPRYYMYMSEPVNEISYWVLLFVVLSLIQYIVSLGFISRRTV